MIWFLGLVILFDQSAIQQQIDDTAALGGGVVTLPEGTTILTRLPNSSGCLLLENDVVLQGHVNGSTLKMADDQPDFTRLILVEDDANVTIRDITLDGNKANQAGAGSHRAGIFALSCSNLLIQNVTAHDFTGDGIQIYTDVQGLEVMDCTFQDTDRDGIALTGFGADIKIHDCTFNGVVAQSIDFEPNQTTWFYDRVEIHDCDVQREASDYSLVIAQIRDGLFYDNTIKGTVQIIWSDNIRFLDNSVKDGSHGAIFLRRWSNNVLISGNELESPAISTWAPIRIIAHPNQHVADLQIINNTITSYSAESVRWQGGYRATIANNDIHHHGSGSVFYVRSTEDMEDTNIVGNVVHAPAAITFVEFRGFQAFSFNRVTVAENQALGPIVNVNATINGLYQK
jgi:hypothetical protein